MLTKSAKTAHKSLRKVLFSVTTDNARDMEGAIHKKKRAVFDMLNPWQASAADPAHPATRTLLDTA